MRCLAGLSLLAQAVLIPWFMITEGMGDPEVVRLGAFSLSAPAALFVFALIVFLVVVGATVLAPPSDCVAVTAVRVVVLAAGSLFDLCVAYLALWLMAGPDSSRLPWLLSMFLIVATGLMDTGATIVTERRPVVA